MMFDALQEIHRKPAPFSVYTAKELWTNEHTSQKMLGFHLDGTVDLSSRKTEFIERSVRWIVQRFGLDAGKSVMDLGCGPGLYASRLAASGAAVTGVDFSERSIRYAREHAEVQGVAVRYVCEDYLDYAPGHTFDLVTLIMCDYCALSPEQRALLLSRIRACLKPGGALLFDVYSMRAFDEKEERVVFEPNLLDGFWSSASYFGFLTTFKYPDQRVTLDKYTIIEPTRTRVVYNWLQYYDAASLERELEGAGFAIEELFGDVAGGAFEPLSSEPAVVARLRAR